MKKEFTGVWFLKNKSYIDEEVLEENVNNVYVTQIPAKFHNDTKIVEAKEDELEKWKRFEAYDDVEMNDDQHILSTRWVVTKKDDTQKIRAKLSNKYARV